MFLLVDRGGVAVIVVVAVVVAVVIHVVNVIVVVVFALSNTNICSLRARKCFEREANAEESFVVQIVSIFTFCIL